MVVSAAAEYNPFHNGHMRHIELSKFKSGCDYFIAVMGGNFTQRGEPAIFDKHTRARAALLGGADLVIELPTAYACASAEYFARGAVSVIKNSGVSDAICFGAESGDARGLAALAGFFYNGGETYKAALKKHLSGGVSYPAARKRAAAETDGMLDASLLDSPNNILGVEYLKACLELGYDARVFAIERDSDHRGDTITSGNVSAAAVRKAILTGGLDGAAAAVPGEAFALYQNAIASGNGPYTIDGLSRILRYIVATRGAEYLKNIFEVSEGLENRVAASSDKFFYIRDMIADIKTKRYTLTKIYRVMTHIILDITKDEFEAYEAAGGPQYIRVLGFKKSSERLLGLLSKKARLPLVINLKDDMKKLPPLAASMLKREIEAGDVFYMANAGANAAPRERGYEYRVPVAVV